MFLISFVGSCILSGERLDHQTPDYHFSSSGVQPAKCPAVLGMVV